MNVLVTQWVEANVPRLLLIFVLWLIASKALHRFGRKTIQALLIKQRSIFNHRGEVLSTGSIQRIETLTAIFIQALRLVLGVIFILTIIAQLGIPIAPLFAGAGVIGLILGFGLQSLIKDMANGILIVFENQYSKGDRIKVGEIAGKVELVSLRTTILCGDDGTVYYIPNGSITVVSNFSKSKK